MIAVALINAHVDERIHNGGVRQGFGPLNVHVLVCHLVDDASAGFAGVR